MRKRLIIVGHSSDGVELVPMLESNPDIEIVAFISDEPQRVRAELAALDPGGPERLSGRISSDLAGALAQPDLTAVVDAGASQEMREQLEATPGLQITTPVLAQLLYAFGPADGLSKADLLQALREVLDSYNLTLDRRELLNRVLQIAVIITGADRGSLMLWDERERVLRVAVSRGIEEELISKIRVGIGEGIAGRAFATQRAILLSGKASESSYEIVRERDDVGSAISAPLLHEGSAIGVLNLSHARGHAGFSDEDLEFVKDLARLDAKLIARADIYHGLLVESEALRVEVQVRRLVAGRESLSRRLREFCSFVASPVPGSVCRLYLRDPELDVLVLQASSIGLDPLATRRRVRRSEGIAGHVAATRRPVQLRESGDSAGDIAVAYTALPMLAGDSLLGVLELEGGNVLSEPDGHGERIAAAADALAAELDVIIGSARASRQNRRSESLTDLFAALALHRKREDSYDLVTSSTAALLEAEDVVLRVRNSSTGALDVVSWSGVGQSNPGRSEAIEAKLSTRAIERQAPLRIPDLASDSAWAGETAESIPAMSYPLLRAGQPHGCLTVLGLVPAEPVLGQTFHPDDEALLARLASQLELSLFSGASLRTARSAAEGGQDPNHLRARIEEEIARSQHGGRHFALLQLSFERLEPILDALSQEEGDRWIAELQGALEAGLRSFDVLARTGKTTFRALVPDPDGDAAPLLVSLARLASEVLRAQGRVGQHVLVRTGYAMYPADGEDVEALERRAAATAGGG